MVLLSQLRPFWITACSIPAIHPLLLLLLLLLFSSSFSHRSCLLIIHLRRQHFSSALFSTLQRSSSALIFNLSQKCLVEIRTSVICHLSSFIFHLSFTSKFRAYARVCFAGEGTDLFIPRTEQSVHCTQNNTVYCLCLCLCLYSCSGQVECILFPPPPI